MAMLPTTLKSPIIARAQAPRAGSKLREFKYPGMCVPMKVTWKPQTKNPALSSQ